jgi:hypothetical protein
MWNKCAKESKDKAPVYLTFEIAGPSLTISHYRIVIC